MITVTPHGVASVAFAAYFLHLLATVNPLLPKPLTAHSQIPSFRLILAFTVYLPSCLLADLSALSIPFLTSWFVAVLAALRFSYDPSLYQYLGQVPKWLVPPSLLLWRADILIYFIFSIWTLTASNHHVPISVALGLLLTFIGISIFVIGVFLRVHTQGLSNTVRNLIASLFHRSTHPRPVMTVPPTIHDASAFQLLSFRWAFPVIQTGFRRSLEFSDLPPLAQRYSAHNLLNNHFLPAWEVQLRQQNPSVLKALFKSFGLRLVLSGLLKLINDLCILSAPLLLRAVS